MVFALLSNLCQTTMSVPQAGASGQSPVSKTRFTRNVTVIAFVTVFMTVTVLAQTRPADEAVELRRAAELLRAGKLAESETGISHVLVANPRNSDAHNLLGILRDQSGQTADAEREYRAALRFNPNSISAMANLGVLLARTKHEDEAVEMFETVLRAVPDHPQATTNLALLYALRGDDERAVPLFQKAIAIGLETYDVRYHLGVSLYNLKRFEEAKVALDASLKLSPNAAEPYYFLGLIAWTEGKDREAVDFWNQAVMRRPRFPEANFMLGEALRKNKQIRDSAQFYERALDQDPTQFVYYARLGGVYIALRESDRAFKIFSQGLERFAKLPEAHYFVAISARARGDYDLAESELRKSLALAPANVNALAQLGFILLERDRLTEAEATLRQAIAINDKHFYANYDLGRLLVKSHRYKSALPVLQHAATLKPNNSSVHYQLFMALSRLKRKDEADRELATFKQLDEARKARPLEGELDDAEVENPPASPLPSPT